MLFDREYTKKCMDEHEQGIRLSHPHPWSFLSLIILLQLSLLLYYIVEFMLWKSLGLNYVAAIELENDIRFVCFLCFEL